MGGDFPVPHQSSPGNYKVLTVIKKIVYIDLNGASPFTQTAESFSTDIPWSVSFVVTANITSQGYFEANYDGYIQCVDFELGNPSSTATFRVWSMFLLGLLLLFI